MEQQELKQMINEKGGDTTFKEIQDNLIEFYDPPFSKELQDGFWETTISASQVKNLFSPKKFNEEVEFKLGLKKRKKPTAYLQNLFDMGHLAEPHIIGWFGRAFGYKGHIDAVDCIIVNRKRKISAHPDYFSYLVGLDHNNVYSVDIQIADAKYTRRTDTALIEEYKYQLHHQLRLIVNWIKDKYPETKGAKFNIEMYVAAKSSLNQSIRAIPIEFDWKLYKKINKKITEFWAVVEKGKGKK